VTTITKSQRNVALWANSLCAAVKDGLRATGCGIARPFAHNIKAKEAGLKRIKAVFGEQGQSPGSR
jgi:hypothetical protein